MLPVSDYSNTRAATAIRAGATVKKINGVPTVKIDTLKTFADGLCCGMPYATEYVSSTGSSIHVWFGNTFDETKLERVVQTLIYWKDVFVLTWSHGEPQGYRTHYKLDEKKAA